MFQNATLAIEAPITMYLRRGTFDVEVVEVERDVVSRRLRLVSMSCGWAVAALGLTVLVGYVFGIDRLMDVVPGQRNMKANTALCFVLAGAALIAQLRGAMAGRIAAWVMAGLVFCIGVMTLTEEFAGVDLRINQLLFVDHAAAQFPGRMAYLSAMNFCLAAVSLLLLGVGRRTRSVGQVAALLLEMVALAAIVGSLYGVKIFYGSQASSAMALHTGAGFLVLGAGLLVADEESLLAVLLRSKEHGGTVFRRALPWVLVLPVGLGWLYMRPSVNFGNQGFGMAWFAVTLVAVLTAALGKVSQSLSRMELLREELLSEREESAAAVRKSERELRLVTDHLPTLLSYMDTTGRYVRVNRTYEEWLGRAADEIVGKTVWDLLGAGFWERTKQARTRVLQGETVTFETLYPTVQGDRHAQITYAPDLDEVGGVRGIACMVLDVNQRWEAESAARQAAKLVKANEELQEKVATDPLTGLKNRRAFEDRLREAFALARNQGRELSVVMLDVDNFKARNDTWGHAAGDEVLRRLGALLSGGVREPDVAARYGGEEFTVLLPGSGLSAAMSVAERLRQTILEQRWPEIQVTVSLGVASLTETTMDAAELLSMADGALYEAKRAGKDRVCCA